MRVLAQAITVFAVVVAFSTLASAKETRPNVLWMIAEDMGPELGCYGTPQVWSPNIDGLAKRGMRFTQAFTTAPVCSASRSAFMTGMYQTTIGAHNHRSHRDDDYRLPEGVRLLPHRLKEAGYFTANIVELTDDPKERFFRGTGKTDWNFNYDGKAYDSSRWADLKSNQPFYAQINFPETHRGGAWDNAHKQIEKTADPDKVQLPPYYPDHPFARKDWAQYLNTVMALDRKIGFVLDKLKEDGLDENTVVFFFGDHGRAMIRGKQWCYDSGLHIPFIVDWPEQLSQQPNAPDQPELYESGGVSDRLVEAIDFTTTTLAIAGVEKPANMQGRILFGPKADPPREYAFGARDRCDETVFRIRTVRDSRYRYIHNFMPERPFLQINRYKERQYPVIHLMRKLHAEGRLTPEQEVLLAPSRPAEELYDIKNDPYEIHNLAKSAEHQAELKRLRGVLENWIEESGDQGATPEPAEVAKAWEQQMLRYSKGQEEVVERVLREIEELERERK